MGPLLHQMQEHHANGEDHSPEDLTLSYCLPTLRVWAIYFNSIHLNVLIFYPVTIPLPLQ